MLQLQHESAEEEMSNSTGCVKPRHFLIPNPGLSLPWSSHVSHGGWDSSRSLSMYVSGNPVSSAPDSLLNMYPAQEGSPETAGPILYSEGKVDPTVPLGEFHNSLGELLQSFRAFNQSTSRKVRRRLTFTWKRTTISLHL